MEYLYFEAVVQQHQGAEMVHDSRNWHQRQKELQDGVMTSRHVGEIIRWRQTFCKIFTG